MASRRHKDLDPVVSQQIRLTMEDARVLQHEAAISEQWAIGLSAIRRRHLREMINKHRGGG